MDKKKIDIKKMLSKKLKQSSRLLKIKIVLILALVGGIVFLIAGVVSSIIVSYESSNTAVVSTMDDCEVSSSDDGSSSGALEGDADWTKEGTVSFKNAQEIWDQWKTKGLNGSAISGIHGNIAHEGGFLIPDRAQGHFQNDESAGITQGAEPIGGGGGPYQFTPYTKYAEASDTDKWLSFKKQTEFVWSSEFDKAPWKIEYAHSVSPEAAAVNWFNYYERGASFDPRKAESARKAYSVFGGADIESDDSLLGDISDPNTNNGSDSDSVSNLFDCADGEAGSVPDGDGVLPSDAPVGAIFAANQIPNSLKKFLLQNTLSAIQQGISGKEWTNPGNQCVNYTESRYAALYGLKDGHLNGNGIDMAASLISSGKGKKISGPQAGAIASSKGVNSYGHTYIVEHVFKDGSVLISEQNCIDKSGEGAGQTSTWDVQILPKDQSKWGSAEPAGDGFALPNKEMVK